MTSDYLSFNPSIILFKKRKGSRRAGKVSEIVKTRKRENAEVSMPFIFS